MVLCSLQVEFFRNLLGTSYPTHRLHEVVAKRVKHLLSRYRPFAVVMRRGNQHLSRTATRLRLSMGAIKGEARRCSVEVRLLKTKPRQHFFDQLRHGTKHQIARLIADLFDELSWRVQPQRKAWHSESYHAVIFDAAATGLVAFAEKFSPDALQQLIATTESFVGPPNDVAILRAVIHCGGRRKEVCRGVPASPSSQ